MKNKKIIKSITLLSSLMGLAILSSSFSSSVISTKQNNSIKSEMNNQSSNQVNDYGEVLSADASLFINASSKVSGTISYEIINDDEIKITKLHNDIVCHDACFKR